MRIDVVTLFPDEFRQLVDLGVTGRAIREDKIQLQTWNPRDYTADRHRTVDDRPYGGGPGMVMMVEPLAKTLAAVAEASSIAAEVALMSPQGKALDQTAVEALASRQRLILICGRYEGIDERLIDALVDEEWSIGDYVLSGGELAAAVIVDAVSRLQADVLGDARSAEQDSFSDGLLDYPHYTRPEDVAGDKVPKVLLSGDHAAIKKWRRKQALGRTWQRRPELLEKMELSKQDQALLTDFINDLT
ncbi:MAG: tRNA (guanosine(37)-N1)-methyltransferase TrmD [Xanthomonadales bacterium]|nr:tRNA (guanosine(37)-N1)-methyltransferase TrmD [Xanthomonadales bacterium]